MIRALNTATTQVLVPASSCTSAPLAKALVDAHTLGVTVLAGLNTSPHAEDIIDLYEI
jgi:hypothetical protein